MLSAETIKNNYQIFRNIINENFDGDRLSKLNQLYDDYADRLRSAPASSFEHFHNAIPGGYCDHILRVITFSKYQYKMWKMVGCYVDNFTENELIFSALNHDLGKLGLPGDDLDLYRKNKSEWHVKNQGKLYESNPNLPNITISDKTMYILQKYQLSCTLNEYLAIKIHDGVYDDANKPYYMGFTLESKMKSTLPLILHHADMMASRFEFERWANYTGKFNLSLPPEWEMKETMNIDKFTKKLDFDDI
jgi:hypothetical protein